MKLNNWVKDIKRLRINRPTTDEFKRLDFAERTINFDKIFFKKFISSITQEDLITYPSYKDYLEIRKLIAKNNQCNLKNVYFDAGSDACIKNFIHLFCKKNSNIISSTPSFPMYKIYSQFYQTRFIGVKYDKNLNLDLKKIIKKINKKTSFVLLTNPNSPFGDYKKTKEIEAFCKTLKKKNIPLLLDEAYVDFAPSSSIKLIKKYNNLFILRTLSKSWGGAGIRFGYIIGNKTIVNLLNNLQLTYPISNISLKFAKYLFENEEAKQGLIKSIREDFPLQALLSGEESMALGDLSADKGTLKAIFGTDDFNKIQQNLTVVGDALVYTSGSGKQIPVSTIVSRPDGIGYGTSWKLEMQLHPEFAKELEKQRDTGK